MITEAETILRNNGIRVTKPRAIIYDYIMTMKNHPTCEEIYEALKGDNPSLSFATVYNVTEKLFEEKILRRLNSPTGERRYDATVELHGHFYCDSCGKVQDIKCGNDVVYPMKGYEFSNVEITVRGKCPPCLKLINS